MDYYAIFNSNDELLDLSLYNTFDNPNGFVKKITRRQYIKYSEKRIIDMCKDLYYKAYFQSPNLSLYDKVQLMNSNDEVILHMVYRNLCKLNLLKEEELKSMSALELICILTKA